MLTWTLSVFLNGKQVCGVNGKEDRCPSVRSPRGPGGGETEDGHDRVCVLDGQGNEEGIKSLTRAEKPSLPSQVQD